MEDGQVLVVALGHEYRRDDGFGAQVLRALEGAMPGAFQSLFHSGDASDLFEVWNNRRVIVIDACESLGHPGRVHVIRPLLSSCFLPESTISSHGLGLSQAIALGGVLGSLPRDLIVLTVESQDFSSGQGLSAAVAPAVEEALFQLKKLVAEGESRHA